MANEDFMAIAKAYAKAEKELGVEVWVQINFDLYDSGQYVKTLKVYNIPRSMLQRWQWLIHWRYCAFVCQYPRLGIRTYYSYYDKSRGIEVGYKSALGKLISAKTQVTKVQNAINEYEKQQRGLLFNLEADPIYMRAIEKLEEKKRKVADAEAAVAELIKTHNNQ